MASRKFLRFKIVVCSMLLGGLWSLNEHYIWASLRNYSVKATIPNLEKRLWDIFPPEVLRFWPLFLFRMESVGTFLEKTLPVTVRTRMTGPGRFVTEIKPLSPWLLLEWRGEVWCVSREGRMWNIADESTRIGGMSIPEKPLWKISSKSERADESPLPGGVFPSLLPMDSIAGFLEKFESETWFGAVEEIDLDRRGGADLFRLRLVRKEQLFVILIQEDKYEWQYLNFTLRYILDRLMKEGGSYEIDATYKGKVVEKKLSAGSGEGSSK